MNLDRSGAVVLGNTGSDYRHIWMTSDVKLGGPDLKEPIALCGAPYDGRRIEAGSNKNLPVCERCAEAAAAAERLGGRIEVNR